MPNPQVQDLLQRKSELIQQTGAILSKAADEKRFDLQGDEQKSFDTLHDELERINKHLDRIAKQAAATEGDGRRTEPPPPDPNAQRQQRQMGSGRITEADRQEAFRAWALGGTKVELSEAQRDLAKRCGFDVDKKLINLHFGPAMKPTRYTEDGLVLQPEDLRTWQIAMDEKRAALTGAQSTTTTGGYTTADATMRALEVALLAFGGMRTNSTVIRTDTGGPLPIPTTNDTGNKGEIIGENLTSNELEMTFGQLVLNAYKYSSKYILASIEFMQDSSINVAEFIGSALGDRIGRIQNDHFTTGTGTGQPKGIVAAAAASGVTGSGQTTVSYDNIVDLIHSVDPAYRSNGRFMFHDGGLKMLKKIKALQYSGDTTGVPLWQPSLVAGQPDLILGYPYTVNQSMATPATTVKSILFGDFSKYLIRDVLQIELRRLDERFAEFGQVAFLAFARADGNLLDAGTNPVKYLVQA